MLVAAARDIGVRVIDRCNLTILFEPGQKIWRSSSPPSRLKSPPRCPATSKTTSTASAARACSRPASARCSGSTRLGYGTTGSPLKLNLVYNPQGPVLPPVSRRCKRDYQQHLFDGYGIVFNELYVLTNMPIQRFGSTLVSKGQFDAYLKLLKDAYQPANLDTVMCRSLLSVDWQGYVYDCDFNQMLELPLAWKGRPRTHLRELIGADLDAQPDHCQGPLLRLHRRPGFELRRRTGRLNDTHECKGKVR